MKTYLSQTIEIAYPANGIRYKVKIIKLDNTKTNPTKISPPKILLIEKLITFYKGKGG